MLRENGFSSAAFSSEVDGNVTKRRNTKVLFKLSGNVIYTKQKNKIPETPHNSCS